VAARLAGPDSTRESGRVNPRAARRSHPPELAAILFRRTLIATGAVAMIVTLGLGTLTVSNVRQEVRAAQELVEQAVHASRQSGGPAGAALLQPDQASLRGLRLRLVDASSGSAAPGPPAIPGGDMTVPPSAEPQHAGGLLEQVAARWFGVSDHFSIPLTDDPAGPALLVQGHAVGELQEQLIDMSIVLAALALALAALGLAHAWVMRSVRDPLTDMTRAAVSMAEGELSRRIPEPRVAEFASLARALNHLAASLEQTRSLQAGLTAELLSLRENERKSLARELHDDLGQRLAVLAAETHLLRVQLGSEGSAVRSIAAGIQALQHLVRSMLERLRQGQPMVPTDPDAVAILGDWRRREAGVHWTVENLDADALSAFDEPRREALARVLQEALANAFRHARPRKLTIRLTHCGAWALLVVCNDGVTRPLATAPIPAAVGSPVPERLPASTTAAGSGFGFSPRAGEGHGILGMTERAHGVGGQLQTGSGVEPGTWKVVLTLPRSCSAEQAGAAAADLPGKDG
jgi:signal transduction histidine kinase